MEPFKQAFIAIGKAFSIGLGISVARVIEDGEDWKDKLVGAILMVIFWLACAAFCALALAASKA